MVVIAFRDQNGENFNLALTEGVLKQTIATLVGAISAFPKHKMESGANWLIPTDWFEFGSSEGGEFLRLRMPSGGNFAFSLPGQMAANMRDVLVGQLGPGANFETPEGNKN